MPNTLILSPGDVGLLGSTQQECPNKHVSVL